MSNRKVCRQAPSAKKSFEIGSVSVLSNQEKTMQGELELPFAADDLPLIYIASPLTRADQS